MELTHRSVQPSGATDLHSMVSEDLMREPAYTIARGVRPLALVGSCAASDVGRVVAAMRRASTPGAEPFVYHHANGTADYGFAAAPWAVELYQWANEQADDVMPDVHRHRISGLLLGYSAAAVSDFENRRRVAASTSASAA